jgi:hypothetical protein
MPKEAIALDLVKPLHRASILAHRVHLSLESFNVRSLLGYRVEDVSEDQRKNGSHDREEHSHPVWV